MTPPAAAPAVTDTTPAKKKSKFNIAAAATPQGSKRAVTEVGGKMAPQLWHVGAVRTRDPEWTPPGPYDSPSGLSRPGKEFGKGMTDEEVADAIAAFAQAAADAKALGFDAVELHF